MLVITARTSVTAREGPILVREEVPHENRASRRNLRKRVLDATQCSERPDHRCVGGCPDEGHSYESRNGPLGPCSRPKGVSLVEYIVQRAAGNIPGTRCRCRTDAHQLDQTHQYDIMKCGRGGTYCTEPADLPQALDRRREHVQHLRAGVAQNRWAWRPPQGDLVSLSAGRQSIYRPNARGIEPGPRLARHSRRVRPRPVLLAASLLAPESSKGNRADSDGYPRIR